MKYNRKMLSDYNVAALSCRNLLSGIFDSRQLSLIEDCIYQHYVSAHLPIDYQLTVAQKWNTHKLNSTRSALMRLAYVRSNGLVNRFINKLIISNAVSSQSSERSRLSHYEQILKSKILQQLNKNGYCVIPGLFSSADLTEINALLDNIPFISDSCRAFASNSEIYSSESASRIVRNSLVREIAKSYLGGHCFFNMITAWKTKPGDKISTDLNKDAMLWHFDHDHNRFLKVFVYLSDVTIEQDPHAYIPRSSQLNLPEIINRDGRFTNEQLGFNVKRRERNITGSRGTVIFADTLNLHKGTPVLKDERRILQLQFTDTFLGGAPVDALSNSYLLAQNIKAC